MTNRFMILAIALAASACAGSSRRSTISVRYACGDTQFLRSGQKLTITDPEFAHAPSELGWSDDEGDHFVAWPRSTTDVEAIEYVLPHDARKDAVVKRYDASAGYSSTDWRLLDKRVCRAEGGYNDALARWMSGDSLEKVAADLSLEDRTTARTLVRKALAQLQKQYMRDR